MERENIAKEVDMDCRGVVEVIAKEVDDEKAKETTAENSSSSSRKQVGQSTGPVDRPQHQERGRPATSGIRASRFRLGFLEIQRARDLIQWGSCVDLRSEVLVFVRSCVDLRRTQGVLKESVVK